MKTKRLTKKQMQNLKFRSPALQESSILTYGYAVRSYFNYLIDNNLEDQFNIDNIKAWLKERYRTSATYNIRLQGIKEFYMKQFEGKPAIQRLRVREAFETIKRMRPSQGLIRGVSYIDYNQVQDLINKSSERTSCYIAALFWTGCRVSELINIRLKDCKNSHHVIIRVVGKGLKERFVYLPKSEYKRILRVFNPQEYLFETLRGTKYNRQIISEEIRRQSRQKLGLSVHAHTLRHSKAMYLKSRGLSPDQIAKALGHSNVTVTLAYYLHGTPSATEQGLIK
jgi:integrase/recombinase XerC